MHTSLSGATQENTESIGADVDELAISELEIDHQNFTCDHFYSLSEIRSNVISREKRKALSTETMTWENEKIKSLEQCSSTAWRLCLHLSMQS